MLLILNITKTLFILLADASTCIFLWVTLNNSMILSKTHFGNYLSSAPHRHWSCNATTLHVPAYFYWNLSKINWFLYVKYIPTCHVISNQYIPCFIHWFSTNITLWLHSQSSSTEFDLWRALSLATRTM